MEEEIQNIRTKQLEERKEKDPYYATCKDLVWYRLDFVSSESRDKFTDYVMSDSVIRNAIAAIKIQCCSTTYNSYTYFPRERFNPQGTKVYSLHINPVTIYTINEIKYLDPNSQAWCPPEDYFLRIHRQFFEKNPEYNQEYSFSNKYTNEEKMIIPKDIVSTMPFPPESIATKI